MKTNSPLHLPFFLGLMLVLIFCLLQIGCGDNNKPVWDADKYADDYSTQMLIPSSEAGSYIGKKITVAGTVKSTYYAETENGKPTFINLDKPFPENTLTIVLFDVDVENTGFNRFAYENKQVTITGLVEQYKDEFGKIRPSIHITNSAQINEKAN